MPATWVWEQPDPGALAAWVAAHQVRDVFVATPVRWEDPGRRDDVRRLRALLPRTVRLHALGGDPGWVHDPRAALTWLSTARSTEVFDGAHLDVEPWVLPDWASDRDEVVHAYLRVLGDLVRADHLPLEADVAFWLHEVLVPADADHPQPRRLDEAVLDLLPAVTVLAYRRSVTGPDSITALAAPTLAAARARGRRCRVGVETRDLGPDPGARRQTFFGRPRRELDAALRTADTLLGGWSGWAGTAVHDYPGWVALPTS